MKDEAKAELKKGAIATVVEYAMRFRQLALFLIKEKYLGINLFRINFASMRGNMVVDPNDGSVVTPAGEVDE